MDLLTMIDNVLFLIYVFSFLFMIEHVLPMCLAISWIYSVAMLVQSIVYEKEQRLKEVSQNCYSVLGRLCVFSFVTILGYENHGTG